MTFAHGGREYNLDAFRKDPCMAAVMCELKVSRTSRRETRVMSPTCLPSTAITRNDWPRRSSKARASHAGTMNDVAVPAMGFHVSYPMPGITVKEASSPRLDGSAAHEYKSRTIRRPAS